MILAVWELGNIWKELTQGRSCTEYGTQLQYIQNHWNESPYYEILKQNHIDKITPKFKIGDWVVGNTCWGSSPLKIVDVSDIEYRIEDTNGNSGIPEIEYLEEYYHLWTIQDAKDGDVVVDKSDGTIGIFQSIGH